MVKRGEIWWAELPNPNHSEPSFKRPLAVIQSDAFNRSKINTIICAVLTSNLERSKAPGNILLNSKTTGLPKDSVLNISQIITIDKTMLIEKTGKLTRKQLIELDKSLKLILYIDRE